MDRGKDTPARWFRGYNLLSYRTPEDSRVTRQNRRHFDPPGRVVPNRAYVDSAALADALQFVDEMTLVLRNRAGADPGGNSHAAALADRLWHLCETLRSRQHAAIPAPHDAGGWYEEILLSLHDVELLESARNSEPEPEPG